MKTFLIPLLLMAFSACQPESRRERMEQQERDIEKTGIRGEPHGRSHYHTGPHDRDHFHPDDSRKYKEAMKRHPRDPATLEGFQH